MIPEIKKIYRCGTWSFLNQEKKFGEGTGNIITLLKLIYENTGYKIFSKQQIINENKDRGTVYYFVKM